ncbi:MAG: hypothetical protein IPH12_03940 [Saprospirales bacterium]|nr:hypothetical protein [Saprospirales bacterium]MBK8922578.1 hypothetical protein [Saprospirales bacterium]
MKKTIFDPSNGIFHFAFTLLALLAAGVPAFSQGSLLISEPIALRNDYGYELIGRLKDRILLFREKYDEFEIQAFDNQMRLSWNRKLEDLDKSGIQVLSVSGGRSDFSIVYKKRRRGVTTLHVHKYDAGANLIDSITVKNYGERMFSAPAVEVLHSEDKNCLVALNTAERTRMEATCFRLDNMQVLWDKVLQIDESYYDSNIQSMTVSNSGHFFLVTEHNNRRSRLEAHAYHIMQVHAGPDQLEQLALPDFLTTDVLFTYDNRNNSLVGAGLYSDRNRDRANGVFFVRIPLWGGAPLLHYEAFTDKVVSILRRKDVADDNKGIGDAGIRQLILRHDGGALLVAERHHEIQRGTAAGRGFWRDGMRFIVDYYYDDLLLVALQPNGAPHWTTVLHKKQYSQDDEATFSSYFMMQTPDKLHFMFNDEIKYENTCSEYVVSPIGDFDRNSLLNTFGQNLRLRFRDGIQLNANECLVPSEFRNKLRLVLLKF